MSESPMNPPFWPKAGLCSMQVDRDGWQPRSAMLKVMLVEAVPAHVRLGM